jgi:hypothetical protein
MHDSSDAQKTKAHLLSSNRIFGTLVKKVHPELLLDWKSLQPLDHPTMKTSRKITPEFNQMPTENYGQSV